MFYSGNAWNTVNYAEGWATCTQNQYGVFTSCTDQTPTFALFSQNSGVKGPGGAEVFTDGSGQKWFVYHGFNASQCSGSTCSGSREMRIDKLRFSSGTPVTSAPTYTAQSF
ncbi:MAG: hypothetical protein ACYDAC_10060 [Candidatus Dormibacteria bacterium]